MCDMIKTFVWYNVWQDLYCKRPKTSVKNINILVKLGFAGGGGNNKICFWQNPIKLELEWEVSYPGMVGTGISLIEIREILAYKKRALITGFVIVINILTSLI